MKYSDWQSGTIEPQITGWYERRRKYFSEGKWVWVQMLPAEFMVGGDSAQSLWRCRLTGMPEEWQIENGSFWQWRGKLSTIRNKLTQ